MLLWCGVAAYLAVVAFVLSSPIGDTALNLLFTLFVGFIAYGLSYRLIPSFGQVLKKAGLFGRDLNKPPELAKDVPESLGVVVGTVYLICVIIMQVAHVFTLPHSHSLSEFNAALTSVCFMIFLGFVDDVLDLRWRDKLILPTIGSIPLLVAYSGPTAIMVPPPFQATLGVAVVELGFLFQVYMCLLSVFCTNSINILAGINGLEAGQALVIACFVLVHNFIQIVIADGQGEVASQHLFSVSLMVPFVGATSALLHYNWYPSQVFVGDCFTYFAGVTFAVAGILAHFPKTLILLFIPQIINFIYSIPQLLKIVHCPRHRLPKLNPATGKLEPTPNYNLVNLFLRVFGPMNEEMLCKSLLYFQAVSCVIALAIRYGGEIMIGV